MSVLAVCMHECVCMCVCVYVWFGVYSLGVCDVVCDVVL